MREKGGNPLLSANVYAGGCGTMCVGAGFLGAVFKKQIPLLIVCVNSTLLQPPVLWLAEQVCSDILCQLAGG